MDFISDLGPLIRVRQGRLGPVDHGPDPSQFGVECRERLLIRRNIFFGVDRIYRAFRNAHRTIDALVRINHQKVRTDSETINRAYVNTIGIPAPDAGFCDHMGHGLF